MIEQVIEQLGLPVHVMQPVEDSFSSTVYYCQLTTGDSVYLKIPFSAVKAAREIEAYHLLKGKVNIPTLLDHWRGDDDCPGALVLSALPGRPLTKQTTPEVAYQVGELHAHLHEIQPSHGTSLTAIQQVFHQWDSFIDRQFYSFAEDVKKVLEPQIVERTEALYERLKKQLPPIDGPSFIHMDFRPGNIIVDADEVTGVIDFESVRIGATATDFTKIYRNFLKGNSAFYEAYEQGYRSVRPLIALDKVLPFYQMTDSFNAMGWCVRRGVEEHQAFYDRSNRELMNWLEQL